MLPPHLGSFDPNDVVLLLKDVTGQVEERETALRERDIQAGRHYSEDLPIEQVPSPAYEKVFDHLMETQLPEVALHRCFDTPGALRVCKPGFGFFGACRGPMRHLNAPLCRA